MDACWTDITIRATFTFKTCSSSGLIAALDVMGVNRSGVATSGLVRVVPVTTGEVNDGDFVLNCEKHPIFDTTNCVQGTYVM